MDGQSKGTQTLTPKALRSGRSAFTVCEHSWDKMPIGYYGGELAVVLKCMRCGERARFLLIPD